MSQKLKEGSCPPVEKNTIRTLDSAEEAAATNAAALHEDAVSSGDRGKVQVLDNPPSVGADSFVDAETQAERHGSRLTALHVACMAGHQVAVQVLLDKEAYATVNEIVEVLDLVPGLMIPLSALELAIRNGHESVACLLLRHPKFDAADPAALWPGLMQGIEAIFPMTPSDALQTMAFRDMEKGVQAYLAWHSQRKPCDSLRVGALWQAANAGHGRIVQVLGNHPCVDVLAELQHGHSNNQTRFNALHQASWRGHLSVVQAILGLSTLGGAHAAAINAKSSGRYQGTALHWALLQHHEGVARRLLRSAAFTAVNAVDGLGRTALHIACQEQLEEISIEIIRSPRFSRHRHRRGDFSGRTAMAVAEEKELRRVLQALARLR